MAFDFEQVINSVFLWVKWVSHSLKLFMMTQWNRWYNTLWGVWHMITQWGMLATMILVVICMGLLSKHMISCKAHSCGTLAGWLLSSVFYQWEEWSAEKSGDFTELVCDSTRALPGMVGKQEVHRSGIHRGGGAVLAYPAGQIFNHSHLCKKIPQRLYQRRASCKKPEDEVRENKTFSTFQTMK